MIKRKAFGLVPALLLLLGQSVFGQVERPQIVLNATTQTSPAINLVGLGVNQHKFQWSTVGTVSAGACALLGSADNVTYGTTIIAAQTVTSSGGPTTVTTSNANWVKISCASPSTPIVGSGYVSFDYSGTKDAALNINTSGLSTSANQTNGNQKTQVVDALGNVLPTTASGATSAANSDSVYVTGGDAAATAQVSVTTAATLVLAARAGGRRAASVTKVGTGATMYCGFSSGVTTGNGDYLANSDGISVTYFTNTAIYCISSSGTQTVAVAETY